MGTSVQCNDTPALCYNTSVTWVGTSLFSATALQLVLRHFYYMGRHVSIQCDDTPTSVMALLLHGQARLYSVRRHSCIVLRHLYYVGRHISVQYYTVPSGTYCVVFLLFIVTSLYKQTFI